MFRLGVNQIARTSGARYVYIVGNEVLVLAHILWFEVDQNTLGCQGYGTPVDLPETHQNSKGP